MELKALVAVLQQPPRDYEAHSMEFLKKTKNKEDKLEIVRRKAKFDMACYVDPEGFRDRKSVV